MKKAAVIGCGIAGLASAIRLANRGYKVMVFETNGYAGGKMHEFSLHGYRFDAGPSLFTLPDLVDELYTDSGLNAGDFFRYKKKEIACRYFWEDGTELTAWANAKKFSDEVENMLHIPSSTVWDYLNHSEFIYKTTHKIFLENSLHKWQNYFSPEVIKGLTQLHKLYLFKSLNTLNEEKLKHPKLVQLFNRFATYNGSNPYQTPGIMSMIPHLEHNLGTYFPEGGIYNITQSLYELALKCGVDFKFNTPVEKILIEKKRVKGIETKEEEFRADIIMSNSDVVNTYRKLLPEQKAPEKILKQERSSSAIIFYWGIKKSFPQLDLHNIFFSEDYREEFEAIFEKDGISSDPTVYVNITSKEERADAPPGSENWFVMVNVASDKGQDWNRIVDETRANVLKKLSRILKVSLEELIEVEQILDPLKIEAQSGSFRGALYGTASNDRMAAFLRHPNFSSYIKGLYFCGGSVHPGGGIPLCLLSARIAVDLIDK